MIPFGILGGIAQALVAKKSNKELGKLLGQDPTYAMNPLANEQFGMAKNLFSARLFGAPQEERNIYGANANFNANVQRNATDGSQALALAAAGQGQADQAFSNLQLKEQQNKYNLLGNLNNAYATMIGEGDKEYNDKVRRFSDLSSIKGAQMQNKSNMWKSIFNGINSDANDAASLFGLGAGGGIGNIFGKKKSNYNQSVDKFFGGD